MNQTRPRILFVSHRVTRSGAPMVLLHFLRWVRENSVFDFDVLFRKGGELEGEFAAVAGNAYRWPATYEDLAETGQTVAGGSDVASETLTQRDLLERLKANRYQLIYANSIICSSLLPTLGEALRLPIIVHVHELEGLIQLTCGEGILERALPHVSRFIAASDIVRDNLVEKHGVRFHEIEKIPEFIKKAEPVTRDPMEVREALGIPPDALIVGGCGKVGLRKGTDLFVAVAKRVAGRTRLPVHFVWLGDHGRKTEIFQLRQDVEKLGLAGRVHFPGATPAPQDYFDVFDLFLLTSREDPFPLVCLESGRAGNPTICFNRASGCTEYVDATCGHVSPYMDVDDMASAVVEFAGNRGRREEASRIIRERVSVYSVDRCAAMIIDTIKSVIGLAAEARGLRR